MVEDGVQYHQAEFRSNGERRSGVSSSSFGAMVKVGMKYHQVEFGSNGESRNGVSSSRLWEQ